MTSQYVMMFTHSVSFRVQPGGGGGYSLKCHTGRLSTKVLPWINFIEISGTPFMYLEQKLYPSLYLKISQKQYITVKL